MKIEEMVKEATRLHQAGRLLEAEQLYRQVLQQQPSHAHVRQLLGVLNHQQGRSDIAVGLIGRALALRPNWPQAHSNRGEALRVLGRLDEAIADQRHAVALDPGQAQSPPAGMPLTDWTNELADFADTAALVSNLDLVISVDTAVAHLTGALGKPIWLLAPHVSDWRWPPNGNDSTWYPTMSVFRQQASGCWDEVISRVANALATSLPR